MKIYAVGDEYTGESKFYGSHKAALSAAKARAKHHGHCCYVEALTFDATKSGFIALLHQLPIERINGDEVVEPPRKSNEE